LVDIGANLASSRYKSDLKEVLGRAVAAGVTTLVITGSDMHSNRLVQRSRRRRRERAE
jgi:TatD DNase family protein